MLRAVLLFVLLAAPADAAWIVYTNDTHATVIVQDVVLVRGKPVAGKPVKLAAGETLRQFHAGPITKTVQILEPGQAANKLLSQSDVSLRDKSLILSIRTVRGQVKLVAAPVKK